MKSASVKFTIVVLFVSFTGLRAQGIKQEIIDEALKLVNRDLDEFDYTSCLEMNRQTYMNEFRSMLNEYFDQEDMDEYLDEVETLGGEEIDYAAEDAWDFAHNEIVESSAVTRNEFLDCQAEKIEADVTESVKRHQGDVNEALQSYMQRNSISEETIDVSLPLYKNRTLVSYFNQEQSTMMVKNFDPDFREKALPSVIYASNDDLSAVVSFYEGELTDFHKTKLDERTTVFSAEPFALDNLLQPGMIGKWSQIESVWIEELKAPFPQGKIKIEIHFE